MSHRTGGDKSRKTNEKNLITDMATKPVRAVNAHKTDPVVEILTAGQEDTVLVEMDNTFDKAREMNPAEFKNHFDAAVKSHSRVSFRPPSKTRKGS
jgi:hypothetical protein